MATSLECKIPHQEGLDETPLHVRYISYCVYILVLRILSCLFTLKKMMVPICLHFFRQTGHVTVDVELMTPTHCESCCQVQQIIGVAITDALKNVDCDLPPIGELCGPQSQVGRNE